MAARRRIVDLPDATKPLCFIEILGKFYPVIQCTVRQNLYGVPANIHWTVPIDDIPEDVLDQLWDASTTLFTVYMGTPQTTSGPIPSDELTAVCIGYADTVNVNYSSSQGEILTIDGPDLLGLFADTMIEPQNFLNSTSSNIARQWALNHGLVPKISPTAVPIGNFYQQDTSYLSGTSQSQLDLLTFIANLEGFVFYVDGNTFYFGPAEIGNSFDAYYRSPGIEDTIYDLDVTRHKKGSKDVQVIVQTYDRRNKSTIITKKSKGHTGPATTKDGDIIYQTPTTQTDTATTPAGDIIYEPGTSGKPTDVVVVSGPDDAKVQYTYNAPPGASAKQVAGLAQTYLQRIMAGEITVTGTIIGNLELKRNSIVNLEAGYVYKKASGKYYVSALTHTFDQSGFTTAVESTNFPYSSSTAGN